MLNSDEKCVGIITWPNGKGIEVWFSNKFWLFGVNFAFE